MQNAMQYAKKPYHRFLLSDDVENVWYKKKEETGIREAALMGALMTADEAWSGPKISISIVRRIPET